MSLADWFKKALKVVEDDIIPVGELVLEFVPGVPPIADKVLAQVPNLIGAMEDTFPDPGQGALKKKGLMALAQVVCEDMQSDSKGGQQAEWQKLAPVVSSITDRMITTINTFKPGTIQNDPVTDKAS